MTKIFKNMAPYWYMIVAKKKNLGFDRNARKAVPPRQSSVPRLRLGGRTQLALEGAATLIT